MKLTLEQEIRFLRRLCQGLLLSNHALKQEVARLNALLLVESTSRPLRTGGRKK